MTNRSGEIGRRGFLRITGGAGLLLGVGSIFQGCAKSSGGTPSGTERRTYYFDLSHGDPSLEYHLVAGPNRHRLSAADQGSRAAARAGDARLAAVPDERITHVLKDAAFPAASHQLCYVTSKEPGSTGWRIEAVFIHLPQSFEQALVAYQAKNATNSCALSSADAALGTDYCAYYSQYKTYIDTAKSLIFQHPDIMSLDPGSATYVLNQIVCSRYETVQLAASIRNQLLTGGSWAIHTPIIDPATNAPYKNTKGLDQYAITWTEETCRFAGRAIVAIQAVLKDDPSLGADITNRSSATQGVNAARRRVLGASAGTNSDLQGKLWMSHDGVPSGVAPSQAYNLTLTNLSTERGYRIESFSSAYAADQTTRMVTVTVKNWYARYLGLYVRYYDAEGNALEVPDDIKASLASWQRGHGTDYDTLWGVIEPEKVVLGLPLGDYVGTFTFPVPASANSVAVVAGGLGTGHSDYPDTLAFGAALTALMNLGVPTVFLISVACTAYGQFLNNFKASYTELAIMAEAFKAAVDVAVATETSDPSIFMNLAEDVGGVILKGMATQALAPLAEKLSVALGEGELVDAIPLVGAILTAIAAAGMAAQVGETVGEIVRSPKSFDDKLVFTHDVTVTIHNDPLDPVGFPATAATYEVVALIDNATTRRSGRLPLSDFRTTQLSYTFSQLPQGGKVKYTVGFYAEDGWSAGQGQTDEMDNLADAASITIKESKVPLDASTRYWHLQKTDVDQSGSVFWSGNHQAPAAAPLAKRDALSCANTAGTLCNLAGISVSEAYAAIGFGWESFSSGAVSCGGGTGQLYQLRTLSLLDPPQSAEIQSSCGSRFPYRTVFSLLGTTGDNFYVDPTGGRLHLRQIRFTAPGQSATYDAPGSNLSFGRLNLPPDGLVLHPLRKVVSINRAMSVIEILQLPAAAGPDASAPAATIAAGQGTRPGLLSGPACIGMTADGTILVLEAGNGRVQAFDTGMNPVKLFNDKKDYWFTLKPETESVQYLDMDVEYAGYVYVLSCALTSNAYRLDIYDPKGAWLCRTENVNAGAFTIDFWRNLYALNYEAMTGAGVTSPTVSLWIPSVPLP